MADIVTENNAQERFDAKSCFYSLAFGHWFGKVEECYKEDEEEANLFNLREFIDSFREAYFAFKEDYEKIEKLNFGTCFLVDRDVNLDNEEKKNLTNWEDGTIIPIITGGEPDTLIPEKGKLFLIETKSDVRMVFKKGKDEYKRIEADQEVIKGYIDIIKKHRELFNLLYDLYATHSEIINESMARLSFVLFNKDMTERNGFNDIAGVRVKLANYGSYEPRFNIGVYVDIETGEIIEDKCTLMINEFKIKFPNSSSEINDVILDATEARKDKLIIDILSFDNYVDKLDTMKKHQGKGYKKEIKYEE